MRTSTTVASPPSVSSTSDVFPPHRHRVYGLTVATWIPFPELESAPSDASVDAVFRLGEVPAELASPQFTGAGFQAAARRLLVWIEGVARYLSVDGQEIVVQPELGAIESDLRALLLCSPMGGLLHQRGLLPLHASVIATPRGAVVFMGNSGRGKSTLAAHFRQRGFKVLADDIAVVTFDDGGRPLVQPGLPQFKLWPNSVAELGEEAEALPRLRPQMEKRTLAFPDSFCREPLPLARIYALEADNQSPEVRLQPQSVLGRVRLLLDHTYRAQYLRGLGQQKSHFQSLSRLASAVPITRVIRPDDGRFRLMELADKLAADFA